MLFKEKANWHPKWKLVKFSDQKEFENGNSYETSEFEGNLLLNAGINDIFNALAGAAGLTAYNNTNARLGVGDSTTAAAATQTGLQASTNKAYVGMDASYPTYGTMQEIVFKATFDGTTANYAWNEFIADNGATAAIALNRLVSSQGTKTSGQVWQLTLTISLS